MSLKRQLAEHAERIKRCTDPDLARALAADLHVLAALVEGDYVAGRVLSIAFAHLDILLEHTARLAADRPSDAVIARTVRELGVRPAARALGMSKSAVSRIARAAVPPGTSVSLPTVQRSRTVAALGLTVMEREGGGVVGSLIPRGAPTDLKPGDDQRMVGTRSNGHELVSASVATAVLVDRIERLEGLPANAEAVAKREAERVQLRRRLHEERLALIEALERQGLAIAKRGQKARHTLEYASGPVARAAAAEALQAVSLEQSANSYAQQSDPAKLTKELERTADPRIDELRIWLEYETAATRCYGPPFVPNTMKERERMLEQARLAPDPDPPLNQFDKSAPAGKAFVLNVPHLHGGYDQRVQQDSTCARRH